MTESPGRKGGGMVVVLSPASLLNPPSPGDSCLNWWQNSQCPNHRQRAGHLREGRRGKSFQSLQQHFHLPSPVICAPGCEDSPALWTPHQHIRANSPEGPTVRRDHGCNSLLRGLIGESLVDSWPCPTRSLSPHLAFPVAVNRALDLLTTMCIGCTSILD